MHKLNYILCNASMTISKLRFRETILLMCSVKRSR